MAKGDIGALVPGDCFEGGGLHANTSGAFKPNCSACSLAVYIKETVRYMPGEVF